jgi:[ribosomal protein S18]-alanine N-acetyltransferase
MSQCTVSLRRAGPSDLAAVARIQSACPEASQWSPADYLGYDFLVALADDRVAGFIVARSIGPETEILNLAVDPACRRRGIGRRLVDEIRLRYPSPIYLEVRASNHGARKFYQQLGFQEVTLRPEYYHEPLESAIVMKFLSC